MTAKRKAGRPARTILDRKEWDFDQIPADQLEACFCYEYGRELTKQWPRLLKLLSMVKARAALPGGHRDSSKETKTFRLIRKILSHRFGAFPTVLLRFFPDICWESLDIERRSMAVEQVKNYERGRRYNRITIKILKKSESLDISSLRELAYHNDPYSFEAMDQTAYCGIAINLSYSDTEIAKEFRLSLKEVREEHERLRFPSIHRAFSRVMASETKPAELLKHRKKGRGGYRDKLRWLGALRVLHYYSPSQLGEYPDSNVKVDGPYSHLPDLYDAAKKAQSLLNEIRRSGAAMSS
jgi:hypothetical protein